MSLNKAIFLGRLTKDPEVKRPNDNLVVANFTLAVNRKIKQQGQPSADFIPVVAWGKLAELVESYFVKGAQINVVGRVQTRTYDDKDGNKKYITEVVAEELIFTESKKDSPVNKGKSQKVEDDNDDFPL